MANLGYMQVVRVCNQDCIFCSNPENEKIITLDQAKGQVDDFISRDYDGIILTGGEPTLYPELAALIEYIVSKEIFVRMITNGQKTADLEYLTTLYDAGLRHMHVSVHHFDPKVQAFITRNEDSHANIDQTLTHAASLGMTVDCNITINHYNAIDLHKVALWVMTKYSYIHHFVFNCLDPTTTRCADNPDTIPKLHELEVSLYQALRALDRRGKTFRVERVPLCYMVEYAHCSTETRKICKEEERIVHFLDDKGMVRQQDWVHGKTDACKVCWLDPVCAGLFEMGTHYDPKELYPVFVSADEVRKRVRGEL